MTLATGSVQSKIEKAMRGLSTFMLMAVLITTGCSEKGEIIKITVYPDNIVNKMQGGFGASMHAIEDSLPVSTDNGKYRSWGGSVWGGNPPSEDTAKWNEIYRHADWLGLDWCRVEIDHGMYEPEKGTFSFDNPEMRILYRYLDYCQSRNVDVYFTEMWPDVKWLVHKNFLGDAVAELRSAPNDFSSWASGFATLLSYLINDRKYDCIKWISVNNEPHEEWSWWKDAWGKPQEILPGIKAMHEEIVRRNLPVKLVATDGPVWYTLGDFSKYLPYVGAVSFHDYASVFDWWGTQPSMSHTADMIYRWKDYTRKIGNYPVFMAEFGSFLYGIEKDTDGPSRWLSLLHDIQLAIRLCNSGIDGMNRWSFINRGDLDGQWQLIDTWDPVRRKLADTIKPHPNSYYVYGLLTRFTGKYSDVLLTDVSGEKDTTMVKQLSGSTKSLKHVFAATFRSHDNKNLSLFITNDSEKEKNLEIDLSSFEGKRVSLYKITKETEGKSYHLLDPSDYFNQDRIHLSIDPLSVILLTTYNLSSGDKGMITD